MTDRAITFPRTADGVWLNAETGVRIIRSAAGEKRYMVQQANRYGKFMPVAEWTPILKLARQIALHAALRHRDTVATAYADATVENINRLTVLADATPITDLDFWADINRHITNAHQARSENRHADANEWVRVTWDAIVEHHTAEIETAHVEALLMRCTDHDAPMTSEYAPMFINAPCVRTYACGCQAYGPYATAA